MSNTTSVVERPAVSAAIAEPDPANFVAAQTSGRTVMLRPARPIAGAVRFVQQTRRRIPIKAIVFTLLVVLPTLVSAIYFHGFASNQFVSESRFGIRSAEPLKNDASALLSGGMAAASQIGLDSNVVVQYVQSRELFDTLDGEIGLRDRFDREAVDSLSRLRPDSSIEDAVDYWRGKVDPFFDVTTGTISLRVKAFTPEDALRINQETLRHSELLVNEMSRRSREDGVKLAREEVDKAAERLKKAREAILVFRDRERLLDPKRQADSSIGLIAKLREDHARATAELSTTRFYMNDQAPTMVALVNRVRGIEEQIEAAGRQLTNSNPGPTNDAYSRTVGGFDTLESEKLMAEKYYATTVEASSRAQEVANRQSTYLSVFVKPSLPQASLYPRRTQNVVLTLLASLGVWILLVIAFKSIREHA